MRKRFRSGLLALVLPVFLSVFSGCTEQVRPELDETHAKLQALQELAGAVNWDLHILDLIVKELDDGHTILPETYRLTEDGYEVSFRDGKTIVIPFGKDGVDGRQFIPVGVQDDEDGLYYWKVDGEWLLDADGNRIRAGAQDGFVPQFKVEDGFWKISVDGGVTYSELASCEEMDGMGVFRQVEQTPFGKVILTLWDGETIELSSRFPFRMSFEGAVRDTMLIAAGEMLPIPYKVNLEGETDQPVLVTSGTDGIYLSCVEAENDTTGVVKVQAPAAYADGYILLSANCGGYSALKMITFRPREITPAASSQFRICRQDIPGRFLAGSRLRPGNGRVDLQTSAEYRRRGSHLRGDGLAPGQSGLCLHDLPGYPGDRFLHHPAAGRQPLHVRSRDEDALGTRGRRRWRPVDHLPVGPDRHGP